jgi:hypothetical protein
MKYFLILSLLVVASASSFAQKDSTDITGTWRWMIDKDKKGFIFHKDGFVTVLHGNTKQGGPPGADAEGKEYLKYKVGKIKGFFTLDFINVRIVNKKQVEIKRASGIFIYLKDGRIKVALPEPGKPRPTKLVSGETVVLTRQ